MVGLVRYIAMIMIWNSTMAMSFVLKYFCIPPVAGVVARYLIWVAADKGFPSEKFLPFFSPVSVLELLYTITVVVVHQILHNIGPVFRAFVPLVLYFIMVRYYLCQKERFQGSCFGYDIAVSQAFRAASNNSLRSVSSSR